MSDKAYVSKEDSRLLFNALMKSSTRVPCPDCNRLTAELQAAREARDNAIADADNDRSHLNAVKAGAEALQAKLDAAVRLVRDISVAGYCASAFLASLTEPS